ncbi:HSP70-domain-containing protein [Daedalea quercina L-15889]|uniref:HSP70-domain-containing protein n=1 Tax=Daedalea quercina L-15889 TaxID=1314783 RepID=A0A165NAS9_9APHY|nr:HSP70-domain-containing protein [Daedalea quercina L-15889]
MVPTTLKLGCVYENGPYFWTVADNQTTITLRVCAGEQQSARDNRLLETFQLTDIASAPTGVSSILVAFDIDYDGLLHVSAQDLDRYYCYGYYHRTPNA